MIEMNNVDNDFLQALLCASGVSSDEHQPSVLFRKYLSPYAYSVVTDIMGNTLITSNEQGNYCILLSAHIDEIGMQVTEICENGLLKLRKIGGVNSLHIIGQEVEVHTLQGKIPGVIVSHSAGNNNIVPDIEDCFIDIYCQSQEEAKRIVSLGDYVAFSPNARIIGDSLISKAVDNRIGVFIISQVFRRLSGKLSHINLAIATTTQEEIGLRGMAVLAQNVAPAVCLNIDVTDACQMNKKQLPRMGKGSVLYRNADSNPVLRRMLENVANETHIPIQLAIGRNITGGTDSSRIQLFSPITAVADVSIPCKYMHTHHEQCSLTDVHACILLLETFILHLDTNFPKTPPILTF